MKVLFAGLKPWENKYLEKKIAGARVPVEVETMPEVAHKCREENKDIEILGVFVDSKVGENELALFPRLRYIVALSTGYDNVDLNACKARGISVSNVPSYGEDTVAEYTFALMLDLS